MSTDGISRLLQHVGLRANLSRNGFASAFRDAVGNTPAEFLAGIRIAQARRLLRNGRAIALVAEEVGYNSQPAFSRAFIRETGISPTAWIREHTHFGSPLPRLCAPLDGAGAGPGCGRYHSWQYVPAAVQLTRSSYWWRAVLSW